MTERIFVDTNVLVYLRDSRAPDKQATAERWIRRLVEKSAVCINLQVLNEFMAVMLRRRPDTALDQLREEIETFAVWGERALDLDDVRVAWMVREALGYQWFDCLLLASASNDGCDVFLSEDMSDGARFGDLVIVNPFVRDPDDFLASN